MPLCRQSVLGNRPDDSHLILSLSQSRWSAGQKVDPHIDDGRTGRSGGNLNCRSAIPGRVICRVCDDIVLPSPAGIARKACQSQASISLRRRTRNMLKSMVCRKSHRRSRSRTGSCKPAIICERNIAGRQWVRRRAVGRHGVNLHKGRNMNGVNRVIGSKQSLNTERCQRGAVQYYSYAAVHVAYSAIGTPGPQMRSSLVESHFDDRTVARVTAPEWNLVRGSPQANSPCTNFECFERHPCRIRIIGTALHRFIEQKVLSKRNTEPRLTHDLAYPVDRVSLPSLPPAEQILQRHSLSHDDSASKILSAAIPQTRTARAVRRRC